MKRGGAVYVAAALLFGAAVLWLIHDFSTAPHNSSKSPDRPIGALPLTSPIAKRDRATGERSRARIRNARVSLDRITGVSVQQISDLLASLSSKEIVLLAQQLAKLPIGGVSTGKIAVFFKAWSQLDPASALATALTFSQPWAKTAALDAVLDGASPQAAQQLVASLDALPATAVDSSLRRGLLSKGIVKWSEADPSGAAKFLDSTAGRVLSPSTWQRVAQNWAALDPEATLQWVQNQPDTNNARVAMQGAMDGWWSKDANAAASYAAEHADTISGQQAASIIASRMTSNDPEKAAGWAAGLENTTARKMSELTASVAWASQDPEAAAKWTESLPEADRAGAASAVAGTWAQTDPEGAADWINSLTGPPRDEAISAFSSTVAASDPGTALSWALTISDPTTRDQVAQNLAVQWMLRQPEAAKAWIGNSGLSAEDKARLLTLQAP